MKDIDISQVIISKICDIFSNKLKKHTSASGVAEHSMLIIRSTGSSLYSVDGKDFVLDAEHALFIPAGTEYSFAVTAFGTSHIISFDTQGAEPSPTALHIASGKDLAKRAQSLERFWALKGPAYHSKCLSEIYDLIALIASEHASKLTLAGKYSLIHKSVKYIESHYADPDLYAPLLAEMSGLGQTYYRNIFISVFKMPPTKYITSYRIDKACELLVNTDMSTEKIAQATGFVGASYFCKVFKATKGITPSEFAQRGRKIG